MGSIVNLIFKHLRQPHLHSKKLLWLTDMRPRVKITDKLLLWGSPFHICQVWPQIVTILVTTSARGCGAKKGVGGGGQSPVQPSCYPRPCKEGVMLLSMCINVTVTVKAVFHVLQTDVKPSVVRIIWSDLKKNYRSLFFYYSHVLHWMTGINKGNFQISPTSG